jgi:hypothetical protein
VTGIADVPDAHVALLWVTWKAALAAAVSASDPAEAIRMRVFIVLRFL